MLVRQWGQPMRRSEEDGEEPVINPPGRMEDINPLEVSIVPRGVTDVLFPFRRGQQLSDAEKAQLIAAGLPVPEDGPTLLDMVRSAATAAVEALVPKLTKIIRNQGDESSMSGTATAGEGQPQQPTAATETATDTQATETETPAPAEADQADSTDEAPPAPDVTETMVRGICEKVFADLIKPFESQLKEEGEHRAKLERSYQDLSKTVNSQTSEMQRHFEGFRPAGQAATERGEQPPEPVAETNGSFDRFFQ